MREFRKPQASGERAASPKPPQGPSAKTEKVPALDATVKLPAVPSEAAPEKKRSLTKTEALEGIKRGRLEIAQALRLKGEVLAKISASASLPLEARMRVNPFEDKAREFLGKSRVCSDARKKLDETLGMTVLFTDLLILAYRDAFPALQVVRDSAATKALFQKAKGSSRDALLDSVLSMVNSARGRNCDMRTVARTIEKMLKQP